MRSGTVSVALVIAWIAIYLNGPPIPTPEPSCLRLLLVTALSGVIWTDWRRRLTLAPAPRRR